MRYEQHSFSFVRFVKCIEQPLNPLFSLDIALSAFWFKTSFTKSAFFDGRMPNIRVLAFESAKLALSEFSDVMNRHSVKANNLFSRLLCPMQIA